MIWPCVLIWSARSEVMIMGQRAQTPQTSKEKKEKNKKREPLPAPEQAQKNGFLKTTGKRKKKSKIEVVA